MDLKSYIDSRPIKAEQMAEIIGGVTGAAVRLWLTGARMPTPEIAERIVEVTNGEVTVQDLHETRLSFIRANPPEPKPTETQAGEAA